MHGLAALADPKQPVQRQRPCAAAHQVQQQAGPGQVRWPGIRVNEELNHQRHAQQGECGQPGEQAGQQQQGERVFGPHCRGVSGVPGDRRRLGVVLVFRVRNLQSKSIEA